MSRKSNFSWGSIILLMIVFASINNLITQVVEFIISNIWTIVVIVLILAVAIYMMFFNEKDATAPRNPENPPTDYF